MKESSRFYSSLGLLVILNLVIKPVWIFAIDRQVQNSIGLQEYGRYFSLFNLSVVFSFLLDWGMTTYVNRQLATRQENFIGKSGSLLFIKLLFLGLYAVVISIIAFFTGVDRWDIIWGVILIQALTSLFLFFRAIITAEQWFRTDAFLSVLDKSMMILLCGSFLFLPALFGQMTLHKFLWSQIICTSLAILIVAIIVFQKNIPFIFSKPSARFSRDLFTAALPYAVIILLMSVHYRADGFLLERIHPQGSHEAGIYAGAYRLLDAANMIGFLFASFLLPFIARQWNDKPVINAVIINARHLLLMFALGASCMVIFLAPWIQELLYHHIDNYSIDVLQYCIPALVGYSLVSIYGTVMTAAGHLRPLIWIVFTSVVVNLSLNLLLIPDLGAKGCCIAALVSQLGCGFSTLFYTKFRMEIRLHVSSWLAYLFVTLFLCAFFYWGNSFPVSKWLLISSGAFLTLMLMLLTRLLRPAEWITSLRKSHL